MQAQKAEAQANVPDTERHAKAALHLNVAGIVTCVVSWFIVIVALSVSL